MNLSVLIALVSAVQASDTLVTQANNPPVWGEDAELVEELRIGSIDGPEEYTFGYVSGLAIGPNGTVIIADGQIPAIRQYGPDGQWIMDVGRQGQGPGEYNSVFGIRMLEGGPLAILDPRNGRVTRYVNGEYSTSFPSRSGLFSFNLFAVDTAGISYVRTLIRDPQRPPTPGEARDEGWIRIRQDGQVTDTLAIPAEDPIGGGFELAGKGGSYRPFTVMTVNAISPHGYLVTCRNDEYSLLRPLRDGRTLRIERDSEPIRVRPEEKRQWNAWVERFQRRSQQQGRQGSYGPIPDVKPFVRHLFVDDDARIWVAVYAEARFTPYSEAERADRGDRPSLEWNQPLVWEVFHPRGQFLGRVTLPDKTSLLAARGTTVWGSQSGAYDEDYVVRFRIRKGAMSTNPDG